MIRAYPLAQLRARRACLQAELQRLEVSRQEGRLTSGRYGSAYRLDDAEAELRAVTNELERREAATARWQSS